MVAVIRILPLPGQCGRILERDALHLNLEKNLGQAGSPLLHNSFFFNLRVVLRAAATLLRKNLLFPLGPQALLPLNQRQKWCCQKGIPQASAAPQVTERIHTYIHLHEAQDPA